MNGKREWRRKISTQGGKKLDFIRFTGLTIALSQFRKRITSQRKLVPIY